MAVFQTLKEAVAEHIHDGDMLALEGFTHLIPFAAGHEIIRQEKKELHLVRMTPDIIYDQMIGMGCAKQLTFSWGGNPGVGSLHRLRDAVEHQWPNALTLNEHTHAGMAVAYTAGAAHIPFGVLRGYIGTDLTHVNNAIKQIQCPFTDEWLTAIPALNPDVTILHAQKADKHGNVLLQGITGAGREAGLASKKLIVTVEEIVDDFPPMMNAVMLPHWLVSVVVLCKGGAYPSYAQNYYPRDNAFYLDWDAIARERTSFQAWMKTHVLDVQSQQGFLQLMHAELSK